MSDQLNVVLVKYVDTYMYICMMNMHVPTLNIYSEICSCSHGHLHNVYK